MIKFENRPQPENAAGVINSIEKEISRPNGANTPPVTPENLQRLLDDELAKLISKREALAMKIRNPKPEVLSAIKELIGEYNALRQKAKSTLPNDVASLFARRMDHPDLDPEYLYGRARQNFEFHETIRALESAYRLLETSYAQLSSEKQDARLLAKVKALQQDYTEFLKEARGTIAGSTYHNDYFGQDLNIINNPGKFMGLAADLEQLKDRIEMKLGISEQSTHTPAPESTPPPEPMITKPKLEKTGSAAELASSDLKNNTIILRRQYYMGLDFNRNAEYTPEEAERLLKTIPLLKILWQRYLKEVIAGDNYRGYLFFSCSLARDNKDTYYKIIDGPATNSVNFNIDGDWLYDFKKIVNEMAQIRKIENDDEVGYCYYAGLGRRNLGKKEYLARMAELQKLTIEDLKKRLHDQIEEELSEVEATKKTPTQTSVACMQKMVTRIFGGRDPLLSRLEAQVDPHMEVTSTNPAPKIDKPKRKPRPKK